MVGYVQDAIATALRKWDKLRLANVIPVRSVDGESVVVNTPLPAVAIHINGTEGRGNTYFGGGIRLFFDLELLVLLDVPDYTLQKQGGTQSQQLDLSEEVIRCMELSPELDGIKQLHDFNMQFDRLETDTTYGTKGSLSFTIDVHKVVYTCDVAFDPQDEMFNRYVELKKVIINNNDINESIIE